MSGARLWLLLLGAGCPSMSSVPHFASLRLPGLHMLRTRPPPQELPLRTPSRWRSLLPKAFAVLQASPPPLPPVPPKPSMSPAQSPAESSFSDVPPPPPPNIEEEEATLWPVLGRIRAWMLLALLFAPLATSILLIPWLLRRVCDCKGARMRVGPSGLSIGVRQVSFTPAILQTLNENALGGYLPSTLSTCEIDEVRLTLRFLPAVRYLNALLLGYDTPATARQPLELLLQGLRMEHAGQIASTRWARSDVRSRSTRTRGARACTHPPSLHSSTPTPRLSARTPAMQRVLLGRIGEVSPRLATGQPKARHGRWRAPAHLAPFSPQHARSRALGPSGRPDDCVEVCALDSRRASCAPRACWPRRTPSEPAPSCWWLICTARA